MHNPPSTGTETFAAITSEILAFRDARDWRQFHTPRQLAAAIAIEAGELQEAMLWRSDDGVRERLANGSLREKVSEELADVLIFTLLLAHEIGVDPVATIKAKLTKNALRYPVEQSKGSATKYTDR